MATIKDDVRTGRHCAYCGVALGTEMPAIERFGERFCSEAHAEEFTAGVRSARMEAAARTEATPMSSPGPQNWKGWLKRAACWGAPLLVLLAIPLFWSGNAVAATGGSILSALGLLACPLGMYFMMRAMGNMKRDAEPRDSQRRDAR